VSFRKSVRRAAGAALAVALAWQLNCAPVTNEAKPQSAHRLPGQSGPPFDSGTMSPFGHRFGQAFTIEAPPMATTDVELGFIVSTELSGPGREFSVLLNGRNVGTVFKGSGSSCPTPADEARLRIPASLFNDAIANAGGAELRLAPTASVSAEQCVGSSVRVIVDYCDGDACPRANVVEGPPRLVSAISSGNTSLRVVFNEPVGFGATDPQNYSIFQTNVNAESGRLHALSASLSPDMTTVTLETSSQSQVIYTLSVTGIQDLAGNVMSPPTILDDPTRTQFAGTPALNDGPDTDGDGLSDAVEQRGWIVNVRLASGAVETREVTSDYLVADTDGDGLDDRTEYQIRSDPRRTDTDGDTLSDADEYNIIFSSPTDQDSDRDTIDDALEVGLFKTSPLQADTDGDGLSDDVELFDLSRDPRTADLPRPRISVGQVRLSLDERYTYTNEQGESVSVNSSTSTALQSSASSRFGRSDTHNWGSGSEAFIKGGLKLGYDKGVKFEASAEGGYKWTWHDDYSTQSTSESERAAQSAYEASLQRGRELSTTSSVTREVLGARIDVDVNIESAGDIAFSISNIELTLLQPNPFILGNAQVVASLVPSRELNSGNESVFNLGPLMPHRGPIVFSNTDVFPALVEDLLRSPRGLIFRIGNYDLTDELGRNFAFTSQEARDRCVGIVIDRGDADPERKLVALNGQIDTEKYVSDGGYIGGFDASGRRRGVPMDYVLQDILGLEKNRREPNGILAGADFRADTVVVGDDIELVPRGTAGLLPHDVIITAGPNGVLNSIPAPGDELAVVTGYETSPTCGRETADNIIEPLTGGNGIADTVAIDDDVQFVAVGAGADDRLAGGDDVATFPGQIAKPSVIADNGDGVVDTQAMGDDVQLIPFGTTGVAPRTPIIGPGPNGCIDTVPAGDDVFLSPDCGNAPANGPEILVRFENRRTGQFQRTWAIQADRVLGTGGDFGKILLYPGDEVGLAFVQDVDNDGVMAQIEYAYGSSDKLDDTDGDGLDDFVEIAVGWEVAMRGQPVIRVFPNPSLVDSDGDGLTDAEEQDLSRYITNPVIFQQIFGTLPDPENPISTNPRIADTDGDGVSDKEELDGYVVGLGIRAGPDNIANSESLGDDVQKAFVGSTVNRTGTHSGIVILPGPNRVLDSLPAGDDFRDNGRIVRTNPLDPDHDGDTRPDGVERDIGGDPTNINDPDDFRDTDLDGLSDAEEELLGWDVITYDAHGVQSIRHVTSNKYAADTDLDGLPDLLERFLGSDPTRRDTDGDGLSDFDEFAAFEAYAHLSLRFPGFVLNPSGSARYGTSLNRVDTDGDTLSDPFELLEGWRVSVHGASNPRHVLPNPLYPDSDLDGLRDDEEFLVKSDPLEADTDGDGRRDGVDVRRCASTGEVCTPYEAACSDCEGSDPLRPDRAVSITYEYLTLSGITLDGPEIDFPESPFSFEWSFDLGYRVSGNPGIPFEVLFRDEHVAAGPSNLSCMTNNGCFCTSLRTGPFQAPTEFFPSTPNRRTFALQPGDLLILEGRLAEISICNDDGVAVSGIATYQRSIPFNQLDGTFVINDEISSHESGDVTFQGRVRILVEVR
jgi:hypothetical protein